MALTKVGICNVALRLIGVNQTISLITEATVEAEACNDNYDHVRDLCLSEVDWQFARKRLDLSTQAEPPTKPDEWGYQYIYPADCLVPRWITHTLTIARNDQRIPFRVENPTGSARVIYTNQDEACLVYTMQQTDEAQFPPWFAQFVATSLAYQLAPALTSNRNKVLLAYQLRAQAFADAVRGNFEGEEEGPEPDAMSIAARS